MAWSGTFRRAFTLTDLLVISGLIVFIAALAPPLARDVGEDARVAQCLSNLHTLMRATTAYLSDYDGRFPNLNRAATGVAVATWRFGGKTNRDFWQNAWGGAFFTPVVDRPMNPYLLGAFVEPDSVAPDGTRRRTEVPVLRCPSDRSSHQSLNWGWGGSDRPPVPVSCYDDVGTSYQFNLQALNPDGPFGTIYPFDLWTNQGEGWNIACRLLIRQVLANQADTFMFFLEDPLDWACAWRVLTTGNHGGFGQHSVGYLDGHADHTFRDTHGLCGVGWEAIVKEWVWSYGQLDPPSLPYYQDQGVNCEPQ
jgi:hypothetical protein